MTLGLEEDLATPDVRLALKFSPPGEVLAPSEGREVVGREGGSRFKE